MLRNRRLIIYEPPRAMITTERTLALQRLLQQTTGGNATDQRGVGPAPADYGPALRTAYATGHLEFRSQGPPCKAFRKTLPGTVKKKPQICELRLEFVVPAAHDECHYVLELIIREFSWRAYLYFTQLSTHSSAQECVYEHLVLAADVNLLMTQNGRGLRAIANGE